MADPEKVVRTILEEGVDFNITVNKQNLLHKLHIIPTERKFIIYPITVGALLKISKLLVDVDMKSLSDGEKEINLIEVGVNSIVKNVDKMVRVVAYAIVNSNKEPSRRLIRFLKRNLTSKEMLKIIIVVVRQMDVTDFLASTVSATGMNLVNPPKTKIKKRPKA